MFRHFAPCEWRKFFGALEDLAVTSRRETEKGRGHPAGALAFRRPRRSQTEQRKKSDPRRKTSPYDLYKKTEYINTNWFLPLSEDNAKIESFVRASYSYRPPRSLQGKIPEMFEIEWTKR
jgi:hypothetical protein